MDVGQEAEPAPSGAARSQEKSGEAGGNTQNKEHDATQKQPEGTAEPMVGVCFQLCIFLRVYTWKELNNYLEYLFKTFTVVTLDNIYTLQSKSGQMHYSFFSSRIYLIS